MSMGGWNHRGANVTANVKVPDGWMCPFERQQARFMAALEAQKQEKLAQKNNQNLTNNRT